MKSEFHSLATLYRQTLLADVIPFWMKHSPDREYGGYFTCLDRSGQVYDTDKFVWLQARQVWTFSMLYNRVEPVAAWLEMAQSGAEFLRQHCLDPEGRVYFSLDRSGKPLIQPYNIFSDCFVALAFYQYSLAAEALPFRKLARQTLRQILQRQPHPKGPYEKSTGQRPMKGFALPMIIANLMLEMDELLADTEVKQVLNTCLQAVMNDFYRADTGLIHEYISLQGNFLDTFEGRLINPGHGIEAMWFVMDIAQRRQDEHLMQQAVDRTLALLRFGWDEQQGGIFYFLDAKGAPPQQLEWDQKLWWVHLETLVALAKAYRYTRRPAVWEAYQQVHDYTWKRFPDSAHGEWFAYLNRSGEVLLPLKGGKWKGCYHVPRALYECWQAFAYLASED